MTPAERLSELERGENPALIARLPSGFAVMGDSQFLPGYALLLAFPMVEQLNDLDGDARRQFLEDMAKLGDAVRAVTTCKRVNYSIYGNQDPFLHAHVFPRYEWEDPAYSTKPPMMIPAGIRNSVPFDPPKHADLMTKLRKALTTPG